MTSRRRYVIENKAVSSLVKVSLICMNTSSAGGGSLCGQVAEREEILSAIILEGGNKKKYRKLALCHFIASISSKTSGN